MFSLFIPDSARVAVTDRDTSGLNLSWPGCAGCQFSVSVQPDSDIGVDMRIARLVADQRRIDSVNKDPHTEADEFNAIDSPPVAIATAIGHAYVIDRDCGDCAAIDMLFGRTGEIAGVSLGGDDDVPALGRHL